MGRLVTLFQFFYPEAAMEYEKLYHELRAIADEYRRLILVTGMPCSPPARRQLDLAGERLDNFLAAHPDPLDVSITNTLTD